MFVLKTWNWYFLGISVNNPSNKKTVYLKIPGITNESSVFWKWKTFPKIEISNFILKRILLFKISCTREGIALFVVHQENMRNFTSKQFLKEIL